MTIQAWPVSGTATSRRCRILFLVCAALCCSSQLALAQFTQPGVLLSAGGAGGSAKVGFSVGLSGDGNTAIAGGPGDSSNTGAAWVFTRSNGVWTQQGSKLVSQGAQPGDNQGSSVALSADGSTAIVGGPGANNNNGAAWVYILSNGVWTEQSPLTGGVAFRFGSAVALSYDGNTAIVGGPGSGPGVDLDLYPEAAWVFTRSNGAWTQQGSKIVNSTSPNQTGVSVATSADGSTVAVGGVAASVYTYNNGVWTQQAGGLGPDLAQFAVVALSADGNTMIETGDIFSDGAGNYQGARVFTRSGSSWAQQGTLGTSAWGQAVGLSADGYTAIVGQTHGSGRFSRNARTMALVFSSSNGVWTELGTPLAAGPAVALSGDGNTAIVGATGENSGAGAVWVYIRPVVTISASPNPVPMGQSTQLSWTSSDTTACEAANDWLGARWRGNPRVGLPPDGGLSVDPPITSTPRPIQTFDYYAIKCTNASGGSATSQVVVQVDPPFQRPSVIAVCNLVCFRSLYGNPTGQGENPVKADVLLERMDKAAGELGPFAPFGEAQSKIKGPTLLLQSGAIESLQISGSRQPGTAGQAAVTVTLSPGSKVIKLGELGANVRIAEAAAKSTKRPTSAESPASAKPRIVGINFNAGTPSGLLIAREVSPPEAPHAK